jgi:hypothetical protein
MINAFRCSEGHEEAIARADEDVFSVVLKNACGVWAAGIWNIGMEENRYTKVMRIIGKGSAAYWVSLRDENNLNNHLAGDS